ncbi:lysine--tRNA ligase-like isoform X1 [Cotesia typhae]|uniref:lysine--tRNA ligase-like isoform X1 n=1 Tax=Cotesia typhae TaxID=2053667 RepID=UPI003D695F13
MTHNPEFTFCEFYMAYVDYHDLMTITNTLVSGMVKSIHGTHKPVYHPDGPEGEGIEIDFTPSRRLPVITLKEKAGRQVSGSEGIKPEESNKFLSDLCIKHYVEYPPPRSTARLLDKLVGDLIKETCIHPTFITDHP